MRRSKVAEVFIPTALSLLLLLAVIFEGKALIHTAHILMSRWDTAFLTIFAHNTLIALSTSVIFNYAVFLINMLPKKGGDSFLLSHPRFTSILSSLIIISANILRSPPPANIIHFFLPIALIEFAGICLAVHMGITGRFTKKKVIAICGVFLLGAAVEVAIMFSRICVL